MTHEFSYRALRGRFKFLGVGSRRELKGRLIPTLSRLATSGRLMPVVEPLRETIAQVALELGREGGEQGLTMRAIARRMGISATALYQHFEGKSAILEQIWVNGLVQLSEVLEAPLKIQPCQEALIEMGLAYISYARENPWVYGVLMSRPPPDQTLLSPVDAARSQKSFGMIIEAISAGIARGEVPETVVPVRAALHSWASLHGMAALILSGRFDRAYPPIAGSAGGDFVLHFVRNLAYTTTETCPPWFMHQADLRDPQA